MPPLQRLLLFLRLPPRPPPSTTSTSPSLLAISLQHVPHHQLSPHQTSCFSTSAPRCAATAEGPAADADADAHGPHHHHETHYDPPSGWLFGVPPGEKYKKEGWENVWIWGFFGTLGMAVVAYAYKPDSSIQTWALEEARRRLEAEGILPDPSPAPEKK